MTETWIQSAICEVQRQIEEIERECGAEHPELVVKLERCAALMRQDGRVMDAVALESRARALRAKYMSLPSRQGAEPALSEPSRLSSPERASQPVSGMSRLLIGIVAALVGRFIAESNPYLACLLFVWLLISCLFSILGTKIGHWAIASRLKQSPLVDKLACFGLFIWLFPLLGILYGSMVLGMSRMVLKNQKRNLSFSYTCIVLALINGFAGVVLAGISHGR